MSNEVLQWAVFEKDECVNIMRATPSVIEEFQKRHPETGYVLASAYGLGAGDRIRIGDFREKQEDESYKYFRNVPVDMNESGEFVYETKELIYLGE